MKIKAFKFLNNFCHAIDEDNSFTGVLWYFIIFWWFGNMMLIAFNNWPKDLTDLVFIYTVMPMALAMMFGVVAAVLQAIISVVFKKDVAEEEGLEKQFMTMIEPALDALPVDRREEFYDRVYETMRYYVKPDPRPFWKKFIEAWKKG